jgi:hypothetical protein
LAQAVVFFLAAVTPIDGVWLAQGSHFANPSDEFGVFYIRWCVDVHGKLLSQKIEARAPSVQARGADLNSLLLTYTNRMAIL